jgi:hypothetical protein
MLCNLVVACFNTHLLNMLGQSTTKDAAATSGSSKDSASWDKL